MCFQRGFGGVIRSLYGPGEPRIHFWPVYQVLHLLEELEMIYLSKLIIQFSITGSLPLANRYRKGYICHVILKDTLCEVLVLGISMIAFLSCIFFPLSTYE